MEKKRVFNLLKPIKVPESALDKLYNWIIFRARFIVIIIEILVVIVFALKVIEDTNAKNLEKEIQINSSELLFYSREIEPQIRELQKKTLNYSDIWNSSSNFYSVIADVYRFIDPNFANNVSIQINNSQIFILGYDSIENLKILETSLKNRSTTLDRNSVRVTELTSQSDDLNKNIAQLVITGRILENLSRKQI